MVHSTHTTSDGDGGTCPTNTRKDETQIRREKHHLGTCSIK